MGQLVGSGTLARSATRRFIPGLVVVAGLTLAGCGGSSHHNASATSGGGSSSGSLTALCKDNAQNSLPDNPSAKQYSQGAAIVQHMINDAPATVPATIKSEMKEVQSDLVSLSKNGTVSDQTAFTTAAQDVDSWLGDNCGSAGGSTGAAATTSPTTAAASGSSGSPVSLASFCSDLSGAVNPMVSATDPASGNTPSQSDLQQYETTVMKLINEAAAPAISTAFGGDTNVLTPLTNGLGTLSQDLTNAVNGSDPLAVTAVNGDATLLQTWATSNCGSSSSGNSTSAAPTPTTAPADSSSGAATGSQAGDASWCNTLGTVLSAIQDPSNDAENGHAPSQSTVQNWDDTVTDLVSNAPESAQEGTTAIYLQNLSQDLDSAVNGDQDALTSLPQDAATLLTANC